MDPDPDPHESDADPQPSTIRYLVSLPSSPSLRRLESELEGEGLGVWGVEESECRLGEEWREFWRHRSLGLTERFISTIAAVHSLQQIGVITFGFYAEIFRRNKVANEILKK
jgi:hypothetical protein